MEQMEYIKEDEEEKINSFVIRIKNNKAPPSPPSPPSPTADVPLVNSQRKYHDLVEKNTDILQ